MLLSPVYGGRAGDWRDNPREKPRCDPLQTVGMQLEPWCGVLLQAVRRLVGIICLREIQMQRPSWQMFAPAQRRWCLSTKETRHRRLLQRATRHTYSNVVGHTGGRRRVHYAVTRTVTSMCSASLASLHCISFVIIAVLSIVFAPPHLRQTTSLALMLEPLLVLLVIPLDAGDILVSDFQLQLHCLHLVLEADELAVDHRAFGDGGAELGFSMTKTRVDEPCNLDRRQLVDPEILQSELERLQIQLERRRGNGTNGEGTRPSVAGKTSTSPTTRMTTRRLTDETLDRRET